MLTDIQCLKFYSLFCSLLAFAQDAHLHRHVPMDLTTATVERNLFRVRSSAAVNQAAVDSSQQRPCVSSPSYVK